MTLKISRSQVSIQPNPTHGWTQPMTNSGDPNPGFKVPVYYLQFKYLKKKRCVLRTLHREH